jgi:hypothetical protein
MACQDLGLAKTWLAKAWLAKGVHTPNDIARALLERMPSGARYTWRN